MTKGLLFITVACVLIISTACFKLNSSSSLLEIAEKNEELLRFSSIYETAHNVLQQLLLPEAPNETFDLSSYAPFCEADKVDRNSAPPPPKKKDQSKANRECIRWEEQELDMLMMYMDLLAVGMKRSLARQFYRQIRCLSRRNTVINEDSLTWDVCFTYDFSKHVGTLLSHYVKQDAILKSPVENELKEEERKRSVKGSTSVRQILLGNRDLKQPTSSRHLFVSDDMIPNDHNRGLFLLLAFAQSNSFRLFTSENLLHFLREQTSCCDSCADGNYFVNIEQDQCMRDPFGKHCCHKACKSLARLRVGVSSSISYCCENSDPFPCRR